MDSVLTLGQVTARKWAQTHQKARIKVIAELRRRGYAVDSSRAGILTAETSNGRKFGVAVNGQSTENAWLTRTRPRDPRLPLYYVLVYMPPSEVGDRFFVLRQEDQDSRNDHYQIDHPKNLNKTGGGFGWDDALRFENCWSKLPT
jgi:hypothetical protein